MSARDFGGWKGDVPAPVDQPRALEILDAQLARGKVALRFGGLYDGEPRVLLRIMAERQDQEWATIIVFTSSDEQGSTYVSRSGAGQIRERLADLIEGIFHEAGLHAGCPGVGLAAGKLLVVDISDAVPFDAREDATKCRGCEFARVLAENGARSTYVCSIHGGGVA
ncbi:MAG TPA: hypothetical protein VF765_31270 [Polyangiaceae bacterium]